MSVRSRALTCCLCILCLLTGPPPAAAGAWQEERDAGFLAFSNADYAEATEHFEKALAGAREGQASPEELGVILERLTTAYLAVRLFRRARDSIAEWDGILEASAGEPWAERQRTDRDVLSILVSEVIGEEEPDPTSAAGPAAESPQGSAGAPAADADADMPFEPDEPLEIPAD